MNENDLGHTLPNLADLFLLAKECITKAGEAKQDDGRTVRDQSVAYFSTKGEKQDRDRDRDRDKTAYTDGWTIQGGR
jgi:hypothetical protein